MFKVVREDSYYMFMKRFLNTSGGTKTEATVVTSDDVYNSQISWVVSANSHNLVMVETQPNEGDLIIGHDANDLFVDPQKWMKLFTDADSKELLVEAFFTIQTRNRIDKVMSLTAEDGALKAFMVNFASVDNGVNVQISIRVPAPDAVIANVDEKLESLEALVIDHTLVPEDLNQWIEGLAELMAENGILTRPQGLPIIIMADNKQGFNLDKYLESKVAALVLKPIESRRIQFLISQLADSPHTINSPKNINWKER